MVLVNMSGETVFAAIAIGDGYGNLFAEHGFEAAIASRLLGVVVLQLFR